MPNKGLYIEEVAGSKINSARLAVTLDVPIVSPHKTIGEIERILLDRVNTFLAVNYIYVVNDLNVLKGVISIKELFRQPKSRPVSEFMKTDLVVAYPSYTKERVAYIALKHQIKDVPVVDEDRRLLGVITYDVIYQLAYKESRADLLKFAGFRHEGMLTENILEEPVTKAAWHRLPWLLIGLVGGLGAAGIIDSFEVTLKSNLVLASFIPLVVYMSSAVGTQMEAYIIRDLAINPKLNFRQYLGKQVGILFIIAIISSFALYTLSWFFFRQPLVSIVLFVALVCAIFSSLVTGLFIPKIFSHFKMDPANASGPIGTIIQDIMSVVIYLTVATLILN